MGSQVQAGTNVFFVTFTKGGEGNKEPKDVAYYIKMSFKVKGSHNEWNKICFKREDDDAEVQIEFGFDSSSNQTVKELVTKSIVKHVEHIKNAKGKPAFKMFKRDGTIHHGFLSLADVDRENSFQIQWLDKKVFSYFGIVIEDIEKECRSEYARWCL